MSDHIAYALAWAFFALGHSGLANAAVKRRLAPLLGRGQRLAYNSVAIAQFGLIAWVGVATLGGHPAFALPGWVVAAMTAIHVAGWVILIGAARSYDLGRLAGTAQWRGASEDEGLRFDGPHAWVRHPLYAGGYLILWGAAIGPLGLATALWGSLYLALGTWFEERKLLARYGEAYACYHRRVPALLPWKGRMTER
jgi:protein-S-isoprenylcysteine O-methyltransferase Ste14